MALAASLMLRRTKTSLDRPAGFLSIHKRTSLVADGLRRFMTLPGDEHGPAGRGQVDGSPNRCTSILDHLVVEARRGQETLLDLCENRQRILSSRVVQGQNGDVRQLRYSGPHELSLALIALATTTEDNDYRTLGETSHGSQRGRQGFVGMGIVDNDGKGLPGLDRLHPAVDRQLSRDRRLNGVPAYTQGLRGGDRREQVSVIKFVITAIKS